MNKLLIIFLITLSLTCSCNQQQETGIAASGKIVKVGVIAPMSGMDKKSGENVMLGIRTALELQPYLYNGDKIELVVEDNQGTADQTLTALGKLSKQRDVAGVLLMAKSDAVLAAVPVADKYKVPILALIATHPDITKNNIFISQLGFDDIFQGTIAALYVRDEMLINKVAVFSDKSNAHYSFLADEFIRKFTSVGGEIIEYFTGDHQVEELEKILEQLKEKNVQLLYLAVRPEQVINIAHSAGKIGWRPEMLGSDGMLSSIFLDYKEDLGLVNGMMATDFYSSVMPKTEYGQQVSKLYAQLFSEDGTSYAGLGCEGTSILLNAMNRCDNKSDRTCVNDMLRDTRGFEGLYGRITIHENGKTERPIFVNIIEDQKMKFLVKVH